MIDILIAIGSLLTAFFTGVLAWFAWMKWRRVHPTLQVDRWLINGKPKLSGRPEEVFSGDWSISFVVSEAIGIPARLKEIHAAAKLGFQDSVTNLPPQKFSSRVISIHAPYEATVSVEAPRPQERVLLFIDITIRFVDPGQGAVAREAVFHALIKSEYGTDDDLAIVRIDADESRRW
ncbi:MAG: hypothetical protein OXF01_19030 [Gemmatimonadetes bacterium]|nr:hypothetical protein [Gemmatimonadota bacterium]